MHLTRTTVRLRTDLKNDAEKLALTRNTTLQDVFNQALESYLRECSQHKARQIVFKTVDLGVPLDNLTRDDYYDEPKI